MSCRLGILVGGCVIRVLRDRGVGFVLISTLVGISLRAILLCGASSGRDFRFRRLYGCVGLGVFGGLCSFVFRVGGGNVVVGAGVLWMWVIMLLRDGDNSPVRAK